MVEVLEGKWEEIVERGAELQGRRVRVEVLSPANGLAELSSSSARHALAPLRELEAFTPSAEEEDILDDFDEFRRAHPLSFGDLRDLQ